MQSVQYLVSSLASPQYLLTNLSGQVKIDVGHWYITPDFVIQFNPSIHPILSLLPRSCCSRSPAFSPPLFFLFLPPPLLLFSPLCQLSCCPPPLCFGLPYGNNYCSMQTVVKIYHSYAALKLRFCPTSSQIVIELSSTIQYAS